MWLTSTVHSCGQPQSQCLPKSSCGSPSPGSNGPPSLEAQGALSCHTGSHLLIGLESPSPLLTQPQNFLEVLFWTCPTCPQSAARKDGEEQVAQ